MTDDETIVRHRFGSLFGDRAPLAGPSGWPAIDVSAGGSLHLSAGSAAGAPGAGGVGASELPPALGPAGPVTGDRLAGPVTGDVSVIAEGLRRLGGGAFDPGRRGVRALAVVAVTVALAAGFWAWRARPATEPIVAAPAAGNHAPTGVPGSDDAAEPGLAGPGAPGASGELVVTVAGKVHRPGLVRLPPGARLADAIDAAGGALPGVDVAMLNPARRLTDGELVVVGVAPPPAAAQAGGGAPAGPQADAASGRINLNAATLAQLDSLPGVGPVLAQRILDHRQRHGPFRAVSDLRQVDGIGEARYEDLKNLVTV